MTDAPAASPGPWCSSVDLDRHWANGSSSHDGLDHGISKIASPYLTSCDPNRLCPVRAAGCHAVPRGSRGVVAGSAPSR